MKILITGGRGFIGRNLCEYLQDAHAVSCCGRQELDLLSAGGVEAYIKAGRFDVVIHSANYDAAPKHSTKDPSKVLENNLRMFFNLVRCQGNFGKMIYFGSGAEFDRAHWTPKMREDDLDRYVPADQYGLSKYVMTKYVMQGPCNIFNLRLFGVFGKYDDWRTRFLSNACCRVVMDMPVEMIQNRRFDHLYMDDLAKIVKWCIEGRPRHNVYNVCSGETYDFRTLAALLMKVAGKTLDVTARMDGLGLEYSGDNGLLRSELGDFRFSPIQDTLKSLYDWYAGHPELIKRECL